MIRRILGGPLLIPTFVLGVLALGAAGCAARPAADQVTDARNGLLILNVRVFDVAAARSRNRPRSWSGTGGSTR